MSYSACIRGGMCTGCMECQEEPKGYYNKFGEWIPYEDEDDPDEYESIFEYHGDDDEEDEEEE